ncbi:MAG: iron-sulfur cluster assembly accessory protein [Holosporaceae bacterium]|jgi:iron-sulfur cluster assembly accessory protein|nr:iron-sulfur cluster assembly accessory protein [Holosporaceae bacterium]
MEKKIINITDRALDFIKKSIAREQCLGIRINIASGGCQGAVYELNFVNEIDSSDLVIKEGGVDIYIASKAVIFVSEMTMDYVSGPMGGNIVFENPNAKAQCRCGKSFCFVESNTPCDTKCCS